ncbi:MAG TPA: hypothetical protein VGP83_17065 [Pyrinomonadaceae bacterium]|jgi:hypothetical protein|nr:hypothetical protein [Pyrinomonadaceae bacterium]
MPFPEDEIAEVQSPIARPIAKHLRIARELVGLDPICAPGPVLRTPALNEIQLTAYRVWQLAGEPLDDEKETLTIWLAAEEVLQHLPEPYPIPTEG